MTKKNESVQNSIMNEKDPNVVFEGDGYQQPPIQIVRNETQGKRKKSVMINRTLTKFGKAIKFWVERSLKAKKEGDHFPIFGICLGMEGIVLTMEKSINKLKYLMRVTLDSRSYVDGVGAFSKSATKSMMYG